MQIGEGIRTGDSDESELPARVRVRITEVRGLYRPGVDDSAARGEDRPIACGYVPGYTSSDDRGRVFVNHRPRSSASESWDAVRVANTQYIELTARVAAVGGTIQPHARIRWTWSDVDDPSDAAMHQAAAAELDPNGGQGGDNRGLCDFPSRDSQRPAFEPIGQYNISNEVANSCETAIVGRLSRVRLHLTNVGGDNFRVEAQVSSDPNAVHSTGTMTMWKRLDVAYYKMDHVPELPVADAARCFEICHVQMDFTPPRAILHQNNLTSGTQLNGPSAALADQVFAETDRPGWFCLIAADLETSALSDDPERTLHSGPVEVVHTVGSAGEDEWLAIDLSSQGGLPTPPASPGPAARGTPSDIFNASSAEVTDGTADPLLFIFDRSIDPVTQWPRPGCIAFRLAGLEYHSDFQATTGLVRDFNGRRTSMFPTMQKDERSGRWSQGGVGLTGSLTAEVTAGVPVGASGITPVYPRSGNFAPRGRTVVFTGRFRMTHNTPQRSQPFDRAGALRTIVHELTHSFGLPHGCGYHAHDDPPSRACAMNILGNWLYAPGTRQIQYNHAGDASPHLCARHILAMRNTHLEDSVALWTWP